MKSEPQIQGLHFPQDRLVTTAESWSALLRDPSFACSVGILPQRAAEGLAIAERFGGRASYEREVREIVSVFTYNAPSWRFTRNEAIPTGELSRVAEIDVLQMIRDGRKDFTPSVVERDVEILLPEGRKIRGDIVQTAPHPKTELGLHIAHEYVDIFYGVSDTKRCGQELYYSGSLKPRSHEPLQFTIHTEVRFDGELIERIEQTFKPVFKKLPRDRVGGFARFQATEPRREFCLESAAIRGVAEQE